MVGSIDNLEREIEQFQNNVMASGELVKLLSQMLEQVKMQNESFDKKSIDLLTRLDKLPETIDSANSTCNAQIKEDVSKEFEKSLNDFKEEQLQYLKSLENTRSQIQKYIEKSDLDKNAFDENAEKVLKKIDLTIEHIKAENDSTINELTKAIDKIVSERNTDFITEQEKYISSLNDVKKAMTGQLERLNSYEENAITRNNELVKKVESTIEQIKTENEDSINKGIKGNEEVILKRNSELIDEFEKYISELKETQREIKESENKLDTSYDDFINSLKKMNISNLYNQNQDLKRELNKRTTIIMIISIISIIVGIIGLFI